MTEPELQRFLASVGAPSLLGYLRPHGEDPRTALEDRIAWAKARPELAEARFLLGHVDPLRRMVADMVPSPVPNPNATFGIPLGDTPAPAPARPRRPANPTIAVPLGEEEEATPVPAGRAPSAGQTIVAPIGGSAGQTIVVPVAQGQTIAVPLGASPNVHGQTIVVPVGGSHGQTIVVPVSSEPARGSPAVDPPAEPTNATMAVELRSDPRPVLPSAGAGLAASPAGGSLAVTAPIAAQAATPADPGAFRPSDPTIAVGVPASLRGHGADRVADSAAPAFRLPLALAAGIGLATMFLVASIVLGGAKVAGLLERRVAEVPPPAPPVYADAAVTRVPSPLAVPPAPAEVEPPSKPEVKVGAAVKANGTDAKAEVKTAPKTETKVVVVKAPPAATSPIIGRWKGGMSQTPLSITIDKHDGNAVAGTITAGDRTFAVTGTFDGAAIELASESGQVYKGKLASDTKMTGTAPKQWLVVKQK